MNLFTNLYIIISTLYNYICRQVEIYKNIKLYTVKSSFMLACLFINTLLCLSLTHLIFES